MAKTIGWSEDEARAAVSAYFELFKAEQSGMNVNKAKVYRDLSQRFPNRTAKAFEHKFQNISAIPARVGNVPLQACRYRVS